MLKYIFSALLVLSASAFAQTDIISEVAATQTMNAIDQSAPTPPVPVTHVPVTAPEAAPTQVIPVPQEAPQDPAPVAQVPTETADVAIVGIVTVNEAGLFVMRNDTRELIRLIPVDEAQQNTLLGLNGHPITVTGKLAPELVITNVVEQ